MKRLVLLGIALLVWSGCGDDDSVTLDGGSDAQVDAAADADSGMSSDEVPRLIYANIEQSDDEGNAELIVVLSADANAPLMANVTFPGSEVSPIKPLCGRRRS